MRRLLLCVTLASCGVVAVACGRRHGSSRPNASTVTVAVLDEANGAPLAGIAVGWDDPDGTPAGSTMTTVLGTAWIESFPTGGSITVANSAGTAVQARTVLGVKGGDRIELVLPAGGTATPTPTPVFSPAVQLSAYGGAAGYAIELGCVYQLQFGTTGTASVYPDCISAAQTIDAVAIAGTINGQALAWTALTSVAAGTGTLSFGSWSSTFRTLSVSLANPPAGIRPAAGSVYGSVFSHGPGGFYGTADLIQGTSGATTYPVRMVPGVGTSDVSLLQIGFGTVTTSEGFDYYAAGSASLGTSLAIDLGATLQPRPSGVGASLADPARPSLSWTMTPGSTTPAVAVQASISYGSGSQWVVFAPPSVTSPLSLPAMPASMASLVPTGTPTNWYVRFVESGLVTGYDDFRGRFLTVLPAGAISIGSITNLKIAGLPPSALPDSFHLAISEGDKPVP